MDNNSSTTQPVGTRTTCCYNLNIVHNENLKYIQKIANRKIKSHKRTRYFYFSHLLRPPINPYLLIFNSNTGPNIIERAN